VQGHTSFLVYTCICKWNIFLTSIKSIISTVKTKKNRQICRFLTENILQWWGKMQPTIKHFSQKYLAIPASYVPSKRVFSLVAHLVKKNEVSPQSFNYWQYQWIKAWNTTGNNTNNYTIRVWMIIFCFLWTVQSNLFMFDIVCHLLNFPQNLLSLFTVCMDL
jgi:hypothetical protein